MFIFIEKIFSQICIILKKIMMNDLKTSGFVSDAQIEL